jgi:hypothetical protein
MIDDAIPDAKPVMQNTDGLEYLIPRDKEEIFNQVCKEWERLTKQELEYEDYDTLFLSDVNSYIALFKEKEVSFEEYNLLKAKYPHYVFNERNDKYFYNVTKRKGRLEFIDVPLHKNKSYAVIKEAVYNYFIYGILPEDTIYNCKNIFDFCRGVKSKGDYSIYAVSIKDSEYHYEKLQKINRFYNSKSGVKLIKKNNNNDKEFLEAGRWLQTIFNKYEEKEFSEYNIDYMYYVIKAKEEIERILNMKQQMQYKLL